MYAILFEDRRSKKIVFVSGCMINCNNKFPARGEAHTQEVALIVDCQMELEAIDPTKRSLAPGSQVEKDLELCDPAIMTDSQGGRVNKGNARTAAIQTVKLGT